MNYRNLVLVGLLSVCMNAVAGLTYSEQSKVDALNCRASDYQFMSNNRVLLGDSYGAKQQLLLVKNLTSHPVLIDFPEGHVGASAGITQKIARGGWATYFYKPGTTMAATDSDGDAVQRKPQWTCAMQMKDGTTKSFACGQGLFVCEIDPPADSLANADIKAIFDQNKIGWLIVTKSTDAFDSASNITKALKASVVAKAPATPEAEVKVNSLAPKISATKS